MHYLKYFMPLAFFTCTFIAFSNCNFASLMPVYLGFGLIPFLELILKPNIKNYENFQEQIAKENKAYDYVLYFFALLQVASLFYFFYIIKTDLYANTFTLIGRSISMGVLCGLFGINLAHELGHRTSKQEQWLAKICLCTSLYGHFIVEHNKGHHKNVATPHDPASARFGENIYAFYIRAVKGVYLGAWHIANAEALKKHNKKFGIHNEMVQLHIIQIGFLLFSLLLGAKVLVCFILAATIGMLLLESVDYIQHYGLQREATSDTSFERTQPHHSWDSHYPIGRLMLFELTRHSDHHYLASRAYQILRHHNTAPLMPTGYPGTIMLALFPPIWFKIMHKKLNLINSNK